MVTNINTGSSAPSAVETLEFRSLGIEWVVRRVSGERYTFDSLSRLRIALYNQTITGEDELSFNRDIWRTIAEIPDLRSYFWMVWQRAQRGGLPGRSRTLVGESAPSINDFDDEIPTRIVGAPPPAPAALEMQVTIPCFTDELLRLTPPARHVLGEEDALDESGFDEEAPTRIVGAFAAQQAAPASRRPSIIPPTPAAPEVIPPAPPVVAAAPPVASAQAVVPPAPSRMSRKMELLVLAAGALTAAAVVGLLNALGLV